MVNVGMEEIVGKIQMVYLLNMVVKIMKRVLVTKTVRLIKLGKKIIIFLFFHLMINTHAIVNKNNKTP